MKARVIATGEIINVAPVWEIDTTTEKKSATSVKGDDGRIYDLSEVNIEVVKNEDNIDNIDQIPDYWTRLEHQAAIAAMQGIMTNPIGFENIRARGTNIQIETALLASEFAHALVEKMKEEKKWQYGIK